jgi:hypothetical protein
LKELEKKDGGEEEKHGKVTRKSLFGQVAVKAETSGLSAKLAGIAESRIFDRVTLLLVVLYALFAFATVILQIDIEMADDTDAILFAIAAVDVGVLLLFFAEHVMKSIAYGSTFVLDLFNIFDIVVICSSIIVAILCVSGSAIAAQRITPVLRLLRIILVFRRLYEKVEVVHGMIVKAVESKGMITPADLLADLLDSLCCNPRLPRPLRREVAYAISLIRAGKLYEVDTGDAENGDENRNDADATWIKTGMDKSGKNALIHNHEADAKRVRTNVHSPMFQYANFLVLQFLDVKIVEDTNKLAELTSKYLSPEISEWSVDMIDFDRRTGGTVLPTLFTYLVHSNDLYVDFVASREQYGMLMRRINDGYNRNPYHNATHAADVLQGVAWYVYAAKAPSILSLSSLDVWSMFFAAMIHDVAHPGYTNPFHAAIRHPLAILYNDKSILENHHVAFTHAIMARDESNIHAFLPKSDAAAIRELVILMVLSTDTSFHFAELGQLKSRMHDVHFPDKTKPEDKHLVLKNILHSIDISNPTKDIKLALEWTVLILTEFFGQGDKEKELGLPVSMFMDRTTTNISSCQTGFIDVLVFPLYTALEMIFPPLRGQLDNLERTHAFWKEKTEFFAKRLGTSDPVTLEEVGRLSADLPSTIERRTVVPIPERQTVNLGTNHAPTPPPVVNGGGSTPKAHMSNGANRSGSPERVVDADVQLSVEDARAIVTNVMEELNGDDRLIWLTSPRQGVGTGMCCASPETL